MPLAPDEPPAVHIVDDDDWLRQRLASLLRSVGLNALTHSSTQEFLQTYRLDAPDASFSTSACRGLDFREQLVGLGRGIL